MKQPRTYPRVTPHVFDDGNGTKITFKTLVVKHNAPLCSNNKPAWHVRGSLPGECDKCFVVAGE